MGPRLIPYLGGCEQWSSKHGHAGIPLECWLYFLRIYTCVACPRMGLQAAAAMPTWGESLAWDFSLPYSPNLSTHQDSSCIKLWLEKGAISLSWAGYIAQWQSTHPTCLQCWAWSCTTQKKTNGNNNIKTNQTKKYSKSKITTTTTHQ